MKSFPKQCIRMMTAVILCGWFAGLNTAEATYEYTESFEGMTNNHPVVLESNWAAGETDNSAVSEEAITGYAGPNFPLSATNHTKVLILNTRGSVLTNTVTTMVNNDHATLFLDMMAKLVASESIPEGIDSDTTIKMAVLLNTNENIVVMHGGENGDTATFSTNTATTVAEDTWVRLSVPMDLGGVGTFFQVKVNGVALPVPQGFDAPNGTYNQSGSWLRFANYSTQNTATIERKIETIAFSGDGAIDDLVLKIGAPGFYAQADNKTPWQWILDEFDGVEPETSGMPSGALFRAFLVNADPDDPFEIVATGIDVNNKPFVEWKSFGLPPSESTVTIESKTDLTTGTWGTLTGGFAHSDTTTRWTGNDVAPAGPLFLRIRVVENP